MIYYFVANCHRNTSGTQQLTTAWRCATFKSASRTGLPGSSTWNLPKNHPNLHFRYSMRSFSGIYFITKIPCWRRSLTTRRIFPPQILVRDVSMSHQFHQVNLSSIRWTRRSLHYFCLALHPAKFNIAPEMDVWKTSFLLGVPIFRSYVEFRGCNAYLLGTFEYCPSLSPFFEEHGYGFCWKIAAGGRNSFRTFSNEFGCMESWQGSNSHRHCHVSGLVH